MGFQFVIDADAVLHRPKLSAPPINGHKYTRGHAMVISGPVLRTGASRLTARAALAVGAGLVTVLGEPAALAEHVAHLTSIMLRERDSTFSTIDERVRALVIGPAAGINDKLVEDVTALLLRKIPIVLDADALTVFGAKPELLLAMLHEKAVLTPHAGEFARLFPDVPLDNRIGAVRQAAERAGAIILLKGPETVIAAPNGKLAINRHASPWLATAGSGDVLAGLICGIMAQGTKPFEAAGIATWLHGDIGKRGGPGLTAERMVDLIPLVLSGCLSE
jgi:ADP-dependent NAD(P)H-hydrate dehydratase / NAD(P)H-hydrate epimerase